MGIRGTKTWDDIQSWLAAAGTVTAGSYSAAGVWSIGPAAAITTYHTLFGNVTSRTSAAGGTGSFSARTALLLNSNQYIDNAGTNKAVVTGSGTSYFQLTTSTAADSTVVLAFKANVTSQTADAAVTGTDVTLMSVTAAGAATLGASTGLASGNHAVNGAIKFQNSLNNGQIAQFISPAGHTSGSGAFLEINTVTITSNLTASQAFRVVTSIGTVLNVPHNGNVSILNSSSQTLTLMKSTGASMAVWADVTGSSNVYSLDNNAGEARFLDNAGTNQNLGVLQNGQLRVRVTSWGTGGTAIGVSGGLITTSPSSERYKENVLALDTEIDTTKVFELTPVVFDYIEEKGGAHSFGLIAEDVYDVLPCLVNQEINPDTEELRPESVSYDHLSVLLLAELKKLRQEFNAYVSAHP